VKFPLKKSNENKTIKTHTHTHICWTRH